MTAHQIGQKPMTCLGIDLQRPADRTVPGKFPHIENVIALFDSTFTPRPGLGSAAIATGPASKTPWHSMRTLSDPTVASDTWCRVHGIGDRLCVQLSSAPSTITDKLGGWSGNPLTMVPGKPTESPQPFMYVADSLLSRKVDVLGNLKQVGLPAPINAPSALVSTYYRQNIDLFTATTGWTAANGFAAAALLSAGPGRPVNTTTPAANGFVYDADSDLACIAPTAMTNIVVGSILSIEVSTGLLFEQALVEEIHSSSPTLTITRIAYDSGTTGMCSMYVTPSSPNIAVNSLLLITGVASAGTELVRVVDVLIADDGTICIRASTTTGRLATDTVAAVASFTTHTLDTPFASGSISNDGVRTSTASATSLGAPATLSKVQALDLSYLNSSIIGASPDDYMSICFRVSKQSAITEIRVMLDCGSDSVSAGAFTGTEFTRDYFVRAITPSDLTGMLEYLQTALGNRQDQVQRRGVSGRSNRPQLMPVITEPIRDSIGADPLDFSGSAGIDLRPGMDRGRGGSFNDPSGGDITSLPSDISTPPRDQIRPGESRFSCVRFRLSEMQRVGNSDRGFKDIVGLRIALTASAAVTFDIHSWCIHGGREPEVTDPVFSGYHYRYRGRDSATGVTSNYSPASHGPVRPVRQGVLLALTQHPSTECDKLDIERWGGSAPGWHMIATVANSASPTYTDTVSNEAARAVPESEASGLLNCQPWPLVLKPLTGSGAAVAGNIIVAGSGAPWSTSLLRGCAVIANGKLGTVRRVLRQSGDAAGVGSRLELEENIGQSSSAAWEIPRPVLAGQPLPIIAAGDWDQNRLLALGDPNDPSAYYVSRRGNFDASNEYLRFEIPGAILQNAVIHNGSPYVWSTERLYRIDDAGMDSLGNQQFRAVGIDGASGLIARWACCGGPRLAWLTRAGICVSNGGTPINITDDDLYPLFPHPGTSTTGIAVNGINPPNLAIAQEPNLRLSCGGDRIRFYYIDSGGSRRELEYRIRGGDIPSGWYPHAYTPGIAYGYYDEGPGKHAWLMGGADSPTAKLYQLTDDQSDAGTAITWSATPQYENVGDPRKLKRWGDYSTEIDRDGATVNVTPKLDGGATSATLVAITTGSGALVRVGDLGTTPVGSGVLAKNMSLTFSGSVTTERPVIYTWEPTWLGRPEVTQLRATDFEDAAPAGPKLVHGVRLVFDALGATRTASVYRDGNLTTAAALITGITSASGPKRQYFPFETPFYASTLLVLPTDANSWMLFDVLWDAESAPESSSAPRIYSDLGGARWLQGALVDADTENVAVDVRVEGDEAVLLATIDDMQHNGRGKKIYTFDPPVLTHLVRANPAASIRIWDIQWISEPEPESAEHYETQQTTHDITETYKLLRDALITLRSSSTVTFTIYDGSLGTSSTALFTTTIASTANLRKSVRIDLKAVKAKSFIYILDGGGTGFALYRRDTWVRVRGWGRTVAILGGEQASNWSTVAPFGADHRINGALV